MKSIIFKIFIKIFVQNGYAFGKIRPSNFQKYKREIATNYQLSDKSNLGKQMFKLD